ncbi:MAG: PSD1 and planctomycete cytochrome C domain-containing protein [Pirellulales bacterium]
MSISSRQLLKSMALSLVATLPVMAAEPEASQGDSQAAEFFEKKVRPLLVDNCYTCHSANTNTKGGLRVDDINGLLQGGNGGAAVVPGRPDESLLIQAVRYEGIEMPPKKRLSDEQVADLVKWVQDGAYWPKVATETFHAKPNEKYEKLRKEHWAWQPLKEANPPEVKDSGWVKDDVDRFVLAKLEEKNLRPTSDAEKQDLLRRVTFDLAGLPPTLEDVAAFLADDSPKAFEKVVDRLLASQAFGERWGRHWLDVARYGESTGSSRNVPYPHAWRYRDYVINAFNQDKPYDVFLREQIAGDLLPANSPGEKGEQLVATGFLALGVKDVNQRFKVRFIMDNVDEQIDTVSRSVLAVTASCARCHDHKFDPIPTADYYALAGIFQSSDLCAGVRNKMGGGGMDYYDTSLLLSIGGSAKVDSDLPEKIKKAQAAVEEARKEFQKLRDNPDGAELAPDGRPKRAVARQKMNKLQQELVALNDPAALGEVALGVRDGKKIADTEIRLRGEAEKLGPVVPRGFLSIVDLPAVRRPGAKQSGRLELAEWLTSEKNPLTSRVAVNRIWQHLFGRGIVKSVDNFGVTGDVPSHPELLDFLAARFVRNGWSIKKEVRAIVLSHAYQLSCASNPEGVQTDPENRLVWRHSPRRLDAEEIRDATLAAAHNLNLQRPEASVAKEFKVMEIRNNGPEAKKILDQAIASQHRSIYQPLLRGITPRALEVFDFAEQGMVTGSRDTTTVATQALYLLNDPFVQKQSLAAANWVQAKGDVDDGARVDLLYRLTLGRSANPAEIERAKAFLADYEAASAASAPAKPPVTTPPPEAVAATESGTSGNGNDLGVSGQPSTGNAEAPAGKGKPKPPAPAPNPDDVARTDDTAQQEVVKATDAKQAAWASLFQALIGSAEFRYVK